MVLGYHFQSVIFEKSYQYFLIAWRLDAVPKVVLQKIVYITIDIAGKRRVKLMEGVLKEVLRKSVYIAVDIA